MRKLFHPFVAGLLQYLFLGGAALGCFLFLSEWYHHLGIGDGTGLIHGWVSGGVPEKTAEVQAQQQDILVKIYSLGQREFVVLEFSNPADLFRSPQMPFLLFNSLSWLTVLWALWLLGQVFGSIKRETFFKEKIVRRIRLLACLILLFPLFRFLASQVLTVIVSVAQSGSGHFFRSAVHLEEVLLGAIAALVIYTLAGVFHTGNRLQQEQDLTI